MNIEDIKDFIRNRALRCAGSCSSQGSMEFNVLNELYFDLFGEPAVNTIPNYGNIAVKINHIENGHEYIELGLPSGTLWATCNVGATKPEEYGDYFTWGETSTKETYLWNNYLDGNMSNYLDCGSYKDTLKGITNIADTRYDAAKANWGGRWHIPTKEQQNELINHCYWVWTENYNGSKVRGYIVYKAKSSIDKGKKIYKDGTPFPSYTLLDAHIFLPAAGHRSSRRLYNKGFCGYYWSSLIDTNNPCDACCIYFFLDGIYNHCNYSRHHGFTIRPVLNQEK